MLTGYKTIHPCGLRVRIRCDEKKPNDFIEYEKSPGTWVRTGYTIAACGHVHVALSEIADMAVAMRRFAAQLQRPVAV